MPNLFDADHATKHDGADASFDAIERANAGLHAHVANVIDSIGVARDAAIVDIGAGTGAFVMRLQRAGFTNLHAIDIATPKAAPVGIAFHALDIDTGRLPIDDASAKLVVSIEVVEHVENIGTYVGEIARVLAIDGCALLTTPNVQSLEARTRHLLKGRLKQFDSLSDPTHIYPVHLYPFERLLKRHGLLIAEHWGFPTDGSSPTSRGFLQLLVRALRLFGLSSDPAGDHLCMKIVRETGMQNTTSKRDMVASHYE